MCKWGGVGINKPSATFIGEGCIFDTNYPEDIIVEEGVRITAGCIILTHFMDPSIGGYTRGEGCN